MALDLLPDAELVVLHYLATVNDLTTLIGTGLSTELPTPTPARYVTVNRIGGGPANSAPDRIDSARLQVDAWAATRVDASTVGRTLRAAFRAARNVTVTNLGVITGARIVLEPAWRPDTSRTPPTPRFSMTVDVTIHRP